MAMEVVAEVVVTGKGTLAAAVVRERRTGIPFAEQRTEGRRADRAAMSWGCVAPGWATCTGI